jgi:hypothetical protein
MHPDKATALEMIATNWCPACVHRIEDAQAPCALYAVACKHWARWRAIFPATPAGGIECKHFAVRPDENGHCRDPRQDALL